MIINYLIKVSTKIVYNLAFRADGALLSFFFLGSLQAASFHVRTLKRVVMALKDNWQIVYNNRFPNGGWLCVKILKTAWHGPLGRAIWMSDYKEHCLKTVPHNKKNQSGHPAAYHCFGRTASGGGRIKMRIHGYQRFGGMRVTGS
jgi:hypothetical protein